MVIPSTNKQYIERDESIYKIITDEPAKNASSFIKHSERLSNIIANSTAQFTVGIFGGWGTGKTTMMQMIKNQLENIQIISWKDINQDSEKNKLKKFIKGTYKIDWIDNAKCQKLDDKTLILEARDKNDNKFLIDNTDTYSSKQSNKFSLLKADMNSIILRIMHLLVNKISMN